MTVEGSQTAMYQKSSRAWKSNNKRTNKILDWILFSLLCTSNQQEPKYKIGLEWLLNFCPIKGKVLLIDFVINEVMNKRLIFNNYSGDNHSYYVCN